MLFKRNSTSRLHGRRTYRRCYQVNGAQSVRILSIPAVPEGSEYGLFEDIHEFNNSAKFANHLQRAAQKYHGTAFRAFIQAAADNYDDLVTLYDDTMNQAIEEYGLFAFKCISERPTRPEATGKRKAR